MNTVKIQTTQNVEVEYPLASVGDRILATIIDGVVMMVWALAIVMVFAFGNWMQDGGAGLVVLMVLVYLPLLFYHLLCEIFLNGQSIGKRARDIKVIKLNGNSPTVGDYLLRWIFRLVDMGISSGIVAVVAVAASGKGQRLGDMAAGTCVIRTRAVKRRAPELMQIEEDYKIVFPEVNLLSDQDLAQVRKLVSKAQEHQNYELLEKVALRVKEITGIQTDMSDWDFLKTIVKDYQHYTHGEIEVQ
ncbi:RDD family protein [Pontibacter cellulosilyticus]|uniref:RDD family protein n=1 Tax=Pontibacter cellulosilyticus TaxID=1720253 RepID=A0A923N7W8_9BACT|nr:RDD family protein [Pontibacter cellulosilyticus]MBC5994545.1 RDD family protein [Pontibacter cellulosilyticus]